jgi:hypothetical protein
MRFADAVLEFSAQRDVRILFRQSEESNERVGFLVHELRNAVSTASLAVGALARSLPHFRRTPARGYALVTPARTGCLMAI